MPSPVVSNAPLKPNADPYWAQVTALLSFAGSNGATTITDAKANTWTAQGNAQLSTAQSQFGGSSLLLDGTGDYIEATISSLLGTGDFTVEGWFRPGTLGAIASGNAELFSINAGSTNADFLFELGATDLRVSVRNNGTVNGSDLAVAHGMSTNTWYYLSVSVNGTALTLRKNGVLLAAGTLSGTRGNSLSAVRIGRLVASTPRDYHGYVDEFRVTKGVGRYPGAGAYAVPQGPFPRF